MTNLTNRAAKVGPLLAEMSGGPLSNTDSIFAHLEKGLQRNPDAPAVICMNQTSGHLRWLLKSTDPSRVNGTSDLSEPLSITYAQLLTAAKTLAAGWLRRGVKPGSTLLICIPNGAELCILIWACILMRLTIVCLDPSIVAADSHHELRQALHSVKPSVIVVPNEVGTISVEIAILELRLPRPLGMVLEGKCLNTMWSPLSTFADEQLSEEDTRNMLDQARNDDPQRIHSILFTSGTSGKPKGCPLRVAGQTHFLQSWSWLLNEENSRRALQQAHNSRAIAPTQMLQTWGKGGTVLLPSRSFHIEDTISAIDEFGATFVVLSPAMVHAIAEQMQSRSNLNLSSVRTVQIGGDAVSKTVLLKCATLFPDSRICTHHGMSEGVAAFEWPFFHLPASKIPFMGETCPTGTVAPGTTVRLWDAEKQCVAMRNEPGEMHIRSPSIIRHYLHGEGESSFYEDSEGRWFVTGDTATMDDDGIVYILGRSKDVIRREGIKIMPGPLESVLQQYLDTQVCVVGVPNQKMGEQICVVVPRMNAESRNAIVLHVHTLLGSPYTLDTILNLQELGLNDFPVNRTFKVDKQAIQKAVIEYSRGVRKATEEL